jgi:predicted RNA binding protein YcfA (HicA-like mRNA interferase family)
VEVWGRRVMSRIAPISYRMLRRIFELDGFVFRKAKGSHWIGEKAGVLRPVVIPEYEEIGLDIIKSNMRTARMSRERYFELLKRC